MAARSRLVLKAGVGGRVGARLAARRELALALGLDPASPAVPCTIAMLRRLTYGDDPSLAVPTLRPATSITAPGGTAWIWTVVRAVPTRRDHAHVARRS